MGLPNMHEAALAAKHKKSTNREKTKTKCTNPNCLKPGHTSSKCWEKGGGAEAKAPEWFKEMKVKQQCEKGHIATEKDNDHSMGSESVAIFIHEERQRHTSKGGHLSDQETGVGAVYRLWPIIYDPRHLHCRME